MEVLPALKQLANSTKLAMSVLVRVGVLGALLSAIGIGFCRQQLTAWQRTSFKSMEWLEDTQAGAWKAHIHTITRVTNIQCLACTSRVQ